MSTDNKTLADVQPGGRVSLYQERSTHVVYRGSCGNLPCYCWATEDHVVGDEVARYEAQPSLGGQGALPRYRCAGYDCSDEGSEENTGGPLMVADPSGEWVRASDALAARQPVRIYGCCAQPEGELHTAECPNMRHLAARQPVTMDDALAAGDGTLHGAIDHWQERALRAEAELAARQPVGISAEWVLGYLTTDAPEDSREAIRNAFTEYAALSGVRQPVGEPEIWVSPGQLEEHKRRPAGQGSNYLPTRLACEGNFTQPLYTAPPAQQPAQVYLDGLDRALGEAIDQRDRYHEVADDLAGHIAAITGVDIGEHSSANCPWQNAIEAAEEYKPAQAVDLGQLQRFAPHPENRAFGWMEGMREEASGDWLHIDDVRALIDSQAEVQS